MHFTNGDPDGGAVATHAELAIHRFRQHSATIVASLSAAVLTLTLTRDGMLLSEDSPAYLWTSRLIRADPARILDLPTDTLLSIQDRYPPAYSVLLALVGIDGRDLDTARALAVVLAAVSVGMVARLVALHSSNAIALAVSLLVLVSRGYVITLFGFIMSDGLYLALVVAALTCLEPALTARSPASRTKLVVGASILGSIGFLTRTGGIGLVVAISITPLLLGERTTRRWAIAALSAAIGIAPTVAWMAMQSQNSAIGGRRFGWYLTGVDLLESPMSLLWSYLPRQAIDLLGNTGSGVASTVVFVLIISWSVQSIRCGAMAHASPPRRMTAAFLLFGWLHLGTLVISRLFFDPLIRIDGRHPMLWLTCLIAAGGIDLHRHVAAGHRRVAWTSGTIAVLLTAGAMIPLARSIMHPGASSWNLAVEGSSQLAARASEESRGRLIYSNREDILYLQEGAATRMLPRRFRMYRFDRDPLFDQQTRLMGARVRSGNAIVVIYRENSESSVPTKELEALTGLRVTFENDEGVIATYPGST